MLYGASEVVIHQAATPHTGLSVTAMSLLLCQHSSVPGDAVRFGSQGRSPVFISYMLLSASLGGSWEVPTLFKQRMPEVAARRE